MLFAQVRPRRVMRLWYKKGQLSITNKKVQHFPGKQHVQMRNRVVLMAVSKVIPICFGFALLTAVFGKRISRHFLDQ